MSDRSAYKRAYREANHDRVREQERAYYEAHRDEIRERGQRYREAHRDEIRERKRAYYEANREQILERQREQYDPELKREKNRVYREAHRDEINEQQRASYDPERQREYNRAYYEANRDRLNEYDRQRSRERHADPVYREHAADRQRKRTKNLRDAVFGHYGRECACCGTTTDLCIDHINGDGKEHRVGLFGRNNVSLQLYRWIIDHDFPDDLQVLCRPCNTSKGDGEHCRLEHSKVTT